MQAWRRILLVTVALAMPTMACFTFSVTKLANRPHYSLAPIVRIAGASRTVDSLFVTLEVESSGESGPSAYTLEIPLNMPELAVQNEQAPPVMVDGLGLHHVTTANLSVGGQVPAGTQAIPIQTVTVANLAEVTDLARQHGSGLYVFSVTYSPTPSNRHQPKPSSGRALPYGPILTVVQMAPKGEPEHVLVADVHEKTHTHGAWILLTPLAVAGDIVTFPLQLIAGLIIGC
jgi:hypothetical protein